MMKVGSRCVVTRHSEPTILTDNGHMASAYVENYRETEGEIIGVRKPFLRAHRWIVRLVTGEVVETKIS